MSVFQYRVLQPDGVFAEGQLEAPGRQDALRQLEAKGFKPIHLTETKSAKKTKESQFRLPWQSKKISLKELENFTRLLSSLLTAGIPLSRALVILYKEASSTAAQERWKSLHDLVVDGMSLADAMEHFPDTFPRVYTAMVQAGETGGFLDLVLSQIANFQNREKDLRSKVMAALIYPTVLLCLATAVLIFLLVFFIPRFQTIFAGFGAALPLITRLIVGASELVRHYGPVVVLGILLVSYFIRNWLVTPQGKRTWQSWILRLPVFGTLTAHFAMARFCRMLGTLLEAGVPLIQALNVARKSIPNQILFDTVSDSIERVKKGDQLARSMADCPILFSGSVLEMISIAEETGRLDQELIRLASVTEEDLDRQLKTAVALAEPMMLFVIAGFIGTIFIGMVFPIFSIQDYIK